MKTLSSVLFSLGLAYKNMWVGRSKFWLAAIVLFALYSCFIAYAHTIRLGSTVAIIMCSSAFVAWFVIAPLAIALIDCSIEPSRIARLSGTSRQ